MKKNTWLPIALIVVIFISGAAAGFFAGRLTSEKHPPKPHKFPRSEKSMRAMFKERICKRLKLTEEQKKTAMPLIGNWLNDMNKLRHEHAPLYLTAFNKFYKKMTPLLTSGQIKELDKMQARFSRHKKEIKKKTDNTSNLSPKGENNDSLSNKSNSYRRNKNIYRRFQ